MNYTKSTINIGKINFDYWLFMGVFNFPEICWKNNNTSVEATRFLEMTRDTFLIQHVKKKKIFTGDDQPILLDLILTNEEGMINSIDHNVPLGNSDKEMLEFNFNFRSKNAKHSEQRLRFFKGHYTNINQKL